MSRHIKGIATFHHRWLHSLLRQAAMLGMASAFVLLPTFVVAGILEWGGSHWIILSSGINETLTASQYRDSNVFRTPSCQIQKNPEAARRQLADMYANGQRKLAIILWHMQRDKTEDCSGFVLRSSGAGLTPQTIRNLQSLLSSAEQLGFNEAQIRFAPMGDNAPSSWASWSAALAEQNWHVIEATKRSLDGRFPKLRIVYDLSAEMGGLASCVSCSLFTRYLWSQYNSKFSSTDSYGVSIAAAKGRVAKLIDDLRAVGPIPQEIALDIYENPSREIAFAAMEARSRGIVSPRFIVQETYYADPGTYAAIVQAAKEHDVTIRTIMQWPKRKGSAPREIVSETPQFIYRPTLK